MAKMNAVVTTQPKVENKAEEPKKNYDMEAILDRINKLEKENEELRAWKMDVNNPFKDGRRVYDGPRAYCYKMWGWIPVIWFTSFRKDPTKDLVYKNQYGTWESNHYLKLQLADGNTVDVEVNEFNRDYTLSEKIIAEPRTDNKGNLLGYAFNSDEYGEFIVAPNIINE